MMADLQVVKAICGSTSRRVKSSARRSLCMNTRRRGTAIIRKRTIRTLTVFSMTDGLEQYHKLERDLTGVKNANCMAHARRHFANAIKAIGKSTPEQSSHPLRIKHLYESVLFMIWKEL